MGFLGHPVVLVPVLLALFEIGADVVRAAREARRARAFGASGLDARRAGFLVGPELSTAELQLLRRTEGSRGLLPLPLVVRVAGAVGLGLAAVTNPRSPGAIDGPGSVASVVGAYVVVRSAVVAALGPPARDLRQACGEPTIVIGAPVRVEDGEVGGTSVGGALALGRSGTVAVGTWPTGEGRFPTVRDVSVRTHPPADVVSLAVLGDRDGPGLVRVVLRDAPAPLYARPRLDALPSAIANWAENPWDDGRGPHTVVRADA